MGELMGKDLQGNELGVVCRLFCLPEIPAVVMIGRGRVVSRGGWSLGDGVRGPKNDGAGARGSKTDGAGDRSLLSEA